MGDIIVKLILLWFFFFLLKTWTALSVSEHEHVLVAKLSFQNNKTSVIHVIGPVIIKNRTHYTHYFLLPRLWRVFFNNFLCLCFLIFFLLFFTTVPILFLSLKIFYLFVLWFHLGFLTDLGIRLIFTSLSKVCFAFDFFPMPVYEPQSLRDLWALIFHLAPFKCINTL